MKGLGEFFPPLTEKGSVSETLHGQRRENRVEIQVESFCGIYLRRVSHRAFPRKTEKGGS